MSQAEAAEQEIAAGRYRGPLHGVPIAVKDLCFTKGVRTRWATRRCEANLVPDFDATVVERLNAAGAVLLGKLNLTEGAMGGYHPDRDIPINPWDAGRWSGASSSGSGVADGDGAVLRLAGQRHGRLDQVPIGRLRRRGDQTDVGPSQSLRRSRAGRVTGSRGAYDP